MIADIEQITSKEQAQDEAIAFQVWASEQNLSWSELNEWSVYFETLGEKYGLTEEFKENGII